MIVKQLKHGKSNIPSWKEHFGKQDLSSVPGTFQTEHVCNICNLICSSKAWHASHVRSHDSKRSQVDFTRFLLQQRTGNSCQFCNKICRSTAGQRIHIRVHEVNVNAKDSYFDCHICIRACKPIDKTFAKVNLTWGVICISMGAFWGVERMGFSV